MAETSGGRKNELKKLCKSFGYAFSGFICAVKTERNLRIHLVAASLALFLSFAAGLSLPEFLAVLFCISMVISAELFNTALEGLVDAIYPDYSKSAKRAKDISAAAVLITAIISLVVGFLIFLQEKSLAALVAALMAAPWLFVPLVLILVGGMLFVFLPPNNKSTHPQNHMDKP